MAEPRIIIVINGKTYSLCADNAEAIGNMPIDDRRHLITLLETVRHKTDLPRAATPVTRDDSRIAALSKPATPDTATLFPARDPTPVSMGRGDVDALMARLAAEDRRNRKPGLTRNGIYQATAGFLLFIFLLVVIL